MSQKKSGRVKQEICVNSPLLSIDKEFRTMKDGSAKQANEENERRICSSTSTPILASNTKVSRFSISMNNLEAENKTNDNDEDNLADDGVKKRRASAAIASANLTKPVRNPTQLQEQRSRISRLKGEELENLIEFSKKSYELCKSFARSSQTSIKEKKETQKRNRSVDQIINLVDETDDMLERDLQTEKNSKKHRKEQLDEENETNKFPSELSLEPSNLVDSLNCADSRSPVSISLDLDDLEESLDENEPNIYKSITFVINSSNLNYSHFCFLLKKVLKKYKELLEERKNNENSTVKMNIYDISDVCSEDLDGLKKLIETNLFFNSSRIEINFSNDFDSSFQSELVISFVSSQSSYATDSTPTLTQNVNTETYLRKYEENFLASNYQNLKYICVVPYSYEDAVFYHHYLNDKNVKFIEAPIVFMRKSETNETFNLKVYLACGSNSFYDEVAYLLQSLVEVESNLIFKGNKFGLPSAIAKSTQPILTINEFIYETSMKFISNFLNLNYLTNEDGDNEANSKENHEKVKALNSNQCLLIKNINEELKTNFSSILDSFDLNRMPFEPENETKHESQLNNSRTELKSLQRSNKSSKKSSTTTKEQQKCSTNVFDVLKSTCYDYISGFHQT